MIATIRKDRSGGIQRTAYASSDREEKTETGRVGSESGSIRKNERDEKAGESQKKTKWGYRLLVLEKGSWSSKKRLL